MKLAYVNIPKMRLSTADENYFRNLIDGTPIATERMSHQRMELACYKLDAFVKSRIAKAKSIADKAEILKPLILGVLSEDCTVISMPAITADIRLEAPGFRMVLAK